MLDSLPVTYLGTLTAATNEVERPLVKGGPFGTRSVATVTSAAFEGPNISATMPEGVAAGDWLTVRADGSFSLDVRLSLPPVAAMRTADGRLSLAALLRAAPPIHSPCQQGRVA